LGFYSFSHSVLIPVLDSFSLSDHSIRNGNADLFPQLLGAKAMCNNMNSMEKISSDESACGNLSLSRDLQIEKTLRGIFFVEMVYRRTHRMAESF